MTHDRNWPEACWHFDFDPPVSLSDRYGDLIAIAGSVALDQGRQRAPGNLAAQVEIVMEEVRMTVEGAGAGLDSVAKLVAFYVPDGVTGHEDLLRMIETRLPGALRAAITAVPVVNLAFPGMMLEVEGYALASPDGVAVTRSSAVPGVSAGGDWLFVDGGACASSDNAAETDLETQTRRALEKLSEVLAAQGAVMSDVVRMNVYYVSGGETADLMTVGGACARGFESPGPVVTFVPLAALGLPRERVVLDVIAMRGAANRRAELAGAPPWHWPPEWPFVQSLRCGDAVFTGGQLAFDATREVLHPGDMEAQTRLIMDRILALIGQFGMGVDDLMKIGCWYNGGASVETLKRNAFIRTSYYNRPGPTSTGVPVPVQHHPGLEIQIDVVAMAPVSDV